MEYVKKSDVLEIIEHEKALRISYDAEIVLFAVEKSVNKLKEKAEQYCHWLQQDEENSEVWLACDDKLFCLNSGTPSENGMLFCPYCGKNLVEIKYEEQFPHTEDDKDYEPKPNYWGEY